MKALVKAASDFENDRIAYKLECFRLAKATIKDALTTLRKHMEVSVDTDINDFKSEVFELSKQLEDIKKMCKFHAKHL